MTFFHPEKQNKNKNKKQTNLSKLAPRVLPSKITFFITAMTSLIATPLPLQSQLPVDASLSPDGNSVSVRTDMWVNLHTTHVCVVCPVCSSKTAIKRSAHKQNARSTHRPQWRCERQRFCPVSSPQHTRTAPCCCHGQPCSLYGQGGSRTKSSRHFLALPLSCRGTPVACRPVAAGYSCCTYSWQLSHRGPRKTACTWCWVWLAGLHIMVTSLHVIVTSLHSYSNQSRIAV